MSKALQQSGPQLIETSQGRYGGRTARCPMVFTHTARSSADSVNPLRGLFLERSQHQSTREFSMTTIHEKLFRFISRFEFEPSDGNGVPVALYSFRETDDEFDWKTNTFQTCRDSAGNHEGMSLRQHLPQHISRTTISVNEVPAPHEWERDVAYLIKSENLPGSRMEAFAKTCRPLALDRYRQFFGRTPLDSAQGMAVNELCYFRCYELPAGTVLPEGLAYVVDNVPVEGHITVHTTRPVRGDVTSIAQDTHIKVDAMAKLPWKFVGYYLCPAAEVNPQTSIDPDGRMLLAALCRAQGIYSLEQFETLKMLVAAPDYSLYAMVAHLPHTALVDLVDRAYDIQEAPWDVYLLGNFAQLVEAYAKTGVVPRLEDLPNRFPILTAGRLVSRDAGSQPAGVETCMGPA